MNVGPSEIAVDDEREWVELDCAFQFGEFALVLTDVRQRIIAEPLMRGRVVRIQLQSPFVLADCAGIIESVESLERGQSSMGTGRGVIQCERFLRRGLGLRKTIFRRASIESREQLPRLRETGIRLGIVRILFDRLIEVVDRFPQIVRGAFVPEEPAFEVKLVGFRILRRLFRYRGFLRAGESCLQRLGDSFRNLAFDREHIGQFSIVSVGPKMRVGQRVDQLHIHAHLIVRLLHAALQDVRHAKFPRDIAQIVRRTLIFLR